MRLPGARRFILKTAARRRRGVFGYAWSEAVPHHVFAVGLDASLSDDTFALRRVLRQQRLPPFLSLVILTNCWTMWTVSFGCPGAQCTHIAVNDSSVFEGILKAAEESLFLYCREEIREKRPRDKQHVFSAEGKGVETEEEEEVLAAAQTAVKGYCGYHRIVEHILRGCGSCMTRKALVLLFKYAVRVGDSEGATLTKLMELLALVSGGDLVAYEDSLRAVFAVSLPVHIAPIVCSAVRSLNVNANIVRLCLNHVSVVIRGRHASLVTIETVLGSFHECVVMVFHWILGNVHEKRSDMLIQVMSCLKYAPLFLLCEVYCTMEKFGLVTPSVQCKFLANCGIAVAGSRSVPHECGDVVVRAFNSLTRSDWETRHIEEGLVHGGAALIALSREELVCYAYAVRSELRESSHSVMAYVRSKDVVRAYQTLLRLGQSREEGWIKIPPQVIQAIYAVCVLVGRSGSPADVNPLYKALVSFHNPGMILSQCLEYVLSGICDRIFCVDEVASSDTPPRTVLEHIVPFFRTVVTYLGDDVNTDMILAILETTVTVKHFAVPLTSSIVWTLQRSSSLALRELFSRVDPSTNGIPFLNYYALCFARDKGRREVVEHLAMVWYCDATPILKRNLMLAPLYKLWKCPACGRLNSDRFNYCLCSALRNSFLVCARCFHAQDERWSCCESCGVRMRDDAIATAVVRRSWICNSCGANNPARQTIHCFRCKVPSGPVVKAVMKLDAHTKKQLCLCPRPNPADDDSDKKRSWGWMAQYCRLCGWFCEEWAAANSAVWACMGCGELRSTLDRACLNCPHVDCLPFAVVRRNCDPVYCSDCQQPSANPFLSSCSLCGGLLRAGLVGRGKTHLTSAMKKDDDNDDVAVCCSHCGGVAAGDVGDVCLSCGGAMQDADRLYIATRHCEECGGDVEPMHVEVICPNCASFLLPVAKEGWSMVVVQNTMRVLVELPERDVAASVLEKLLQELLKSFQTQVEFGVLEKARGPVAVGMGRLQTHLSTRVLHDSVARRVIALGKQILEYVDAQCGVVGAPYFSSGECRHCLGTHKDELCVYNKEPWICGICGAKNDNADVCRYLCHNCLALRSCVQEACPTETWECLRCQRANIGFEAYCIFCGAHRAAFESAAEKAAEAYPFFPAKCAKCNLVYLESRCPLCYNDVLESMKDTEGVVCMVTSRYAFIQPAGTEHPNQRVYVGEPWLRRRQWKEGEKVTFTAQVGDYGGFRIVSVRL